jgi:hypothetical protein
LISTDNNNNSTISGENQIFKDLKSLDGRKLAIAQIHMGTEFPASKSKIPKAQTSPSVDVASLFFD